MPERDVAFEQQTLLAGTVEDRDVPAPFEAALDHVRPQPGQRARCWSRRQSTRPDLRCPAGTDTRAARCPRTAPLREDGGPRRPRRLRPSTRGAAGSSVAGASRRACRRRRRGPGRTPPKRPRRRRERSSAPRWRGWPGKEPACRGGSGGLCGGVVHVHQSRVSREELDCAIARI